MTHLDFLHNAFKLYWPLASAYSFAIRELDDKVSSTCGKEPATTGSA